MRRDRRRAANNNLRTAVQVIACPNCKEPVLPHRACASLRPLRRSRGRRGQVRRASSVDPIDTRFKRCVRPALEPEDIPRQLASW